MTTLYPETGLEYLTDSDKAEVIEKLQKLIVLKKHIESKKTSKGKYLLASNSVLVVLTGLGVSSGITGVSLALTGFGIVGGIPLSVASLIIGGTVVGLKKVVNLKLKNKCKDYSKQLLLLSELVDRYTDLVKSIQEDKIVTKKERDILKALGTSIIKKVVNIKDVESSGKEKLDVSGLVTDLSKWL